MTNLKESKNRTKIQWQIIIRLYGELSWVENNLEGIVILFYI